ncbi:MAG TPA: hypothetical protein EYN05_02730 [Nitrospinaceae bacterium]|nr:hypothetical protein [Nitrospinaceae bacterium]
MHNIFSRAILVVSKHSRFVIAVSLVALLQTNVCLLLAADTKSGTTISLQELIELSLDYNSKNRANKKYLPPEHITFLVKKYFYQIETQVEQLDTAKEVRNHFQKAVEKSKEIFDSGEGDVSQADLTKLKLGLSNTLNNIIDLEHDIQIGKLNLGKLINQEIPDGNDITVTDPIPIDFPYTSFDDYMIAKNLTPQSKKIAAKVGIVSNEIHAEEPTKLTEENRLLLYKAYLGVTSSKDKVMLGKKNRKITRALLVAEVANYDFGIGDSQELFEALIMYTRVFSSYLDLIYTLNVSAAELEKLTDSIYTRN